MKQIEEAHFSLDREKMGKQKVKENYIESLAFLAGQRKVAEFSAKGS